MRPNERQVSAIYRSLSGVLSFCSELDNDLTNVETCCSSTHKKFLFSKCYFILTDATFVFYANIEI